MPQQAWSDKRDRQYESHRGPGGRTYRQLCEEAKDRGIDGRSKMSKAQLERVLARRG